MNIILLLVSVDIFLFAENTSGIIKFRSAINVNKCFQASHITKRQ